MSNLIFATGSGWDLLQKLESDPALTGVASAKEGLADMRKLFEYLEVYGVLQKVSSSMVCGRIQQLTIYTDVL
jgi:histidyl-tRNA synthetase